MMLIIIAPDSYFQVETMINQKEQMIRICSSADISHRLLEQLFFIPAHFIKFLTVEEGDTFILLPLCPHCQNYETYSVK